MPLIWLLEIYWLESLEFFGQRNITLISVFMFMCHSSLMPIFAHKLPLILCPYLKQPLSLIIILVGEPLISLLEEEDTDCNRNVV